MLVSFGKYDNQGCHITYFSLDNEVVKNLSPGVKRLGMSLPVTITVDKYTVRASTVVLDRKAMIFIVPGKVTVSDGTATVEGKSAILAFPNGKLVVTVEQ